MKTERNRWGGIRAFSYFIYSSVTSNLYSGFVAYKKRPKVPISVTHPSIAKKADGWDPSTVSAGSNKKLKWKCEYGHNWNAMVVSLTSQGQGCAVCAGKKVLIGFNDLATTRPELAKEALGWDPRTVTQGSGKKVLWKCGKGHQWEAVVANRSQGNGCGVCAGKAIAVGENDLLTTHPEIARQAYKWDPRTVSVGSEKIRDWICIKGHVWQTPIYSRTAGNNCSICANMKVLSGYNDLFTTHPELANQANGWDPKLIIAGSHKNLSWRCANGHIWEARPNTRVSMGSECPVCSGRKVLVGYNDLVTTHPDLSSEAVDWDPETKTKGMKSKLLWKCAEGHEWLASPQSRTTMQSGCPTCSLTGFDPSKDGFLYFLFHPQWLMYQIGITNVPNDRVNRHKKLGWEPLQIRGPMDGFLTRQWEQDILKMLRGKNVVLGSKKGVGKFDGYTEAWLQKDLPVSSLHDLMELVRDSE